MSYAEFNPVVKKVNLKADGKKEIVLEIGDSGLDGKLDTLAKMIGCTVQCAIESQVVSFNITLNAQTNEPVTTYKVDNKGIVSEVEPSAEQLEADLGLPKEKLKTVEEKQEIELSVVDEFISSGLAPQFETEFAYDIPQVIKRKNDGETYMKIANELNISSGTIVELVDQYRAKVAPLAEKWKEWKDSQDEQTETLAEAKKEVKEELDLSAPEEASEEKVEESDDSTENGAA
ncbi:helix-turn-helix domain-containing protein [Priestia aryabhattai]|uniref:helix-turn-helix domain-containing protein n=1 Tax=Priestia aryabhattai TaxID=412384 RepID=UPI001C8E6A69|nr:helix-turn-helix domain-containing protein [Priestia aryabhattai]MBX9988642.1 helix-turn-helix domain-containing protein [Priestia aryabhattai]